MGYHPGVDERRRRNGTVYRARVRRDGRTLVRTFSTLPAAVAWRAEALQAVLDGGAPAPPPPPPTPEQPETANGRGRRQVALPRYPTPPVPIAQRHAVQALGGAQVRDDAAPARRPSDRRAPTRGAAQAGRAALRQRPRSARVGRHGAQGAHRPAGRAAARRARRADRHEPVQRRAGAGRPGGGALRRGRSRREEAAAIVAAADAEDARLGRALAGRPFPRAGVRHRAPDGRAARAPVGGLGASTWTRASCTCAARSTGCAVADGRFAEVAPSRGRAGATCRLRRATSPGCGATGSPAGARPKGRWCSPTGTARRLNANGVDPPRVAARPEERRHRRASAPHPRRASLVGERRAGRRNRRAGGHPPRRVERRRARPPSLRARPARRAGGRRPGPRALPPGTSGGPIGPEFGPGRQGLPLNPCKSGPGHRPFKAAARVRIPLGA